MNRTRERNKFGSVKNGESEEGGKKEGRGEKKFSRAAAALNRPEEIICLPAIAWGLENPFRIDSNGQRKLEIERENGENILSQDSS